MLVDEVRLMLNVDAVRPKTLDGGMDVVDLEIEQGGWRAYVEQQAGAV